MQILYKFVLSDDKSACYRCYKCIKDNAFQYKYTQARLVVFIFKAESSILISKRYYLTEKSWDQELCDFFGIPMSCLPRVCSSAEEYGTLSLSGFAGTPISGILGDQQAALVGQGCLRPGTAKNTYGTGCFLLQNTGEKPVQSQCGLLTTVAYQLGKDAPGKSR